MSEAMMAGKAGGKVFPRQIWLAPRAQPRVFSWYLAPLLLGLVTAAGRQRPVGLNFLK
jgi:hypothetical protein